MNENTKTGVQVIENATRKDVRPGDHIIWEDTWERHGVTRTVRREGIAAYRGPSGDWATADGMNITSGEGEGITITIRRPIPELPTTPETVIVANDGHEYITATFDGETYRAREAILLGSGHWQAAWRSDEGVMVYVIAEWIDPDTWKEADQ